MISISRVPKFGRRIFSVIFAASLIGPRRIVTHGDGEVEAIANPILKSLFPGAATPTIAAASICQDEDFVSLRISLLPFALPPLILRCWRGLRASFFCRFASSTRFADPFDVHVVFFEFAPALAHRMGVHADEIGNPLISAVAEPK